MTVIVIRKIVETLPDNLSREKVTVPVCVLSVIEFLFTHKTSHHHLDRSVYNSP